MSCCVCSDYDNPQLSNATCGIEMYESLERPEVHADAAYEAIQMSDVDEQPSQYTSLRNRREL